MNKIAESSIQDREALFRETTARRGFSSPVVIEKDFWVCWILQELFSLENIPRLVFKGGTSLSKGYNLIERFSEDVDLSMNRADLGFKDEADPIVIQGKNARERARKKLRNETEVYIREVLLGKIEKQASGILVADHGFSIDPEDPLTILFLFPTALADDEYGGISYIRPQVRLELGSTSDHEPRRRVQVQPYAAEEFPDLFSVSACAVDALSPERTLWEKATILHAECHRPHRPDSPRAWLSGSRHAYDIVEMARKGVAGTAIDKCLDVLESVVRNKIAFWPSAWAHYDLARPGSFRLVPQGRHLEHLRKDYAKMEQMFFSAYPSFDEILEELAGLELQINSAQA